MWNPFKKYSATILHQTTDGQKARAQFVSWRKNELINLVHEYVKKNWTNYAPFTSRMPLVKRKAILIYFDILALGREELEWDL